MSWALGRDGGFSDKKVTSIESLERYLRVVQDKAPAKFRVCDRVPVGVDLRGDTEELWRSHNRTLSEFSDALKGMDRDELEIEESETPERSLLDLKVELARRCLKSCNFCERKCGVNRLEGERGVCGVGMDSRIASDFIHRGEEPELVPSYTIFFSGCNFQCQFCQNWDISQNPQNGVESSSEKIASSITSMRRKGVKNVNWVGGDPTPNLSFILDSLSRCESNVPSVWNSNMYLTREAMNLLRGTQDLYLTDFKYGNDDCARKYSKVSNYWEVVSRNHRTAFEDAELIIRHLVLPSHLKCCTREIFNWIGKNLGSEVRLNILVQYRPVARAGEYREISRMVSGEEMKMAFEIAEESGLKNFVR